MGMRKNLSGGARRLPILAAVAALLLILTAWPVTAGAGQAGIFAAAPAGDITAKAADKAADLSDVVVRSRLVTIDFAPVLNDQLPRGDESAVLNLFDDVNLVAVKDRLQTNSPTQYVWYGHVKDVEGGYVIMVVNNGQMAANIVLPGERYHVRAADGNVHVVQEINPGAFKQELPPVDVKLAPDKTSDAARATCAADNRAVLNDTAATVAGFRTGAGSNDGSVIDVLVVWSNQVDAVAGIAAEIVLAVAETNQAYANSGITQRINLVYSGLINYDETTDDMGTDLDRFQSGTNGLDEAHTLRENYKADCVLLIVQQGDACGIAYQMSTVTSSFAPYAYAVNLRECATGYYSFAHELGHNMAARHDCYADPTLTPYEEGHGYVDGANGWRTIMAYNNECQDLWGYDCTRIQYFSNPDATYNGAPVGGTGGGGGGGGTTPPASSSTGSGGGCFLSTSQAGE